MTRSAGSLDDTECGKGAYPRNRGRLPSLDAVEGVEVAFRAVRRLWRRREGVEEYLLPDLPQAFALANCSVTMRQASCVPAGALATAK